MGRVELVGADHAPEDLLQGPGAKARLPRRLREWLVRGLLRLTVGNLITDETVKIAGADPDFHRRDMFDAIASGTLPPDQLADGLATGCLHVIDPDGVDAKVYLRGGNIYAVVVPGERPQLGARLVFEH